MNERIEELFGEALDEVVSETWSKLTPGQVVKLTNKFAELLLEDVYEFIMDESAKDNGIPDLGTVKQHFGVKE